MPIAPAHRARNASAGRRAVLAIAAGVWLAAATAHGAGTLAPWNGEPAPALVARDLDGATVRLAEFRGRTVLVNFWATWCAPCVEEMPSLQRLRDRLAEQGFEVLAVNHRESPARVRPFVDRMGLSFPVLFDHDGSVAAAWGARAFPTTFVVGPDGRVALAAIGEIDWDDPAIVARVQRVIGAPVQRAALQGLPAGPGSRRTRGAQRKSRTQGNTEDTEGTEDTER